MSPSAAELLKEALALDETDRAAVAGALIESLEGEEDSDAADAWEMAIRRRVEDLDTGAVTPVPWSEVRERLFSGFE